MADNARRIVQNGRFVHRDSSRPENGLLVSPVATNLVASWLYDKLKKHGTKTVSIDRQEIVVDRGQIERVIREKIEIRE